MSRSNWSTKQYIAHFAREQPAAAAVVQGTSTIRYLNLATKLVQLTKTAHPGYSVA